MKKLFSILSIIAIFGLVTSLIVGIFRNGIILFGDTDLTYHFGNNFFSFSQIYLWNDYFQSGIFDFNKFQGFFLKKIVYLLSQASGIYLFSYLWYFLPIFFYLVSFYFLIKINIGSYVQEEKKIKVISLVLSVLALINGVFILYFGQILFILALVMANLFLLFFIKNIIYIQTNGRNNYKYLVASALFLSEGTIYLQVLFLMAYALAFLSLFYLKEIFQQWRILLRGVAVIMAIFFLLNMSWISVIIHQFLFQGNSLAGMINYNQDLGWQFAKDMSKNIFMYDLLNLKSYHVYNEIPYYVRSFGYIVLFISLFFMIFRKKLYPKLFYVIFSLFLLGIFLSYGIHGWNEGVFKALWTNFPLFNTFRTIIKFSFIFLYAIILLMAIVLAKIKNKIGFWVSITIIIVTIGLNLSYYFQPEFRRNLTSYKIPDYYFDIEKKNIANQDPILGNMIIAPELNWQYQFDWAPPKIDGMNVLPYFYGKGVLVNGPQYTPDSQYIFNDYFDFLLRNGKLDELKDALALRNIKYIAFQDDVRISDDETTPFIVKSNYDTAPSEKSVFSEKFKEEICSKVFKIGKVAFCKIKENYFTPKIYTRDASFDLIKDERYFKLLNEVTTFIPFNKRTEKSHTQLNLIEDGPLILTDLKQLGLASENGVQIMGDYKSFPGDLIDKNIYPSFKPFEVDSCFKGADCNLYFFQDIEPGYYDIYFVHYFSEGEYFDQNNLVQLFDGVQDSLIERTIGNMLNKNKLSDLDSKVDQKFLFNSKENNFVGSADLKGTNIILKTIASDYFNNGRFYLVKTNSPAAPSKEMPSVEFKEINPTKYRVMIHGAKEKFPLIFSESYNDGWRVYVTNDQKKEVDNWQNYLSKYKENDDNGDDQASRNDLKEYVNEGLITNLGNGFISKNIKGTIQNDNLFNGSIWETWFQKPIDNNQNHFMVNGYANSWILDPQDLCLQNSSRCKINSDGTYDFDVVIEFWPQRVFYVGLIISGLTFLACIGYLWFCFYKRKRPNNL